MISAEADKAAPPPQVSLGMESTVHAECRMGLAEHVLVGTVAVLFATSLMLRADDEAARARRRADEASRLAREAERRRAAEARARAEEASARIRPQPRGSTKW